MLQILRRTQPRVSTQLGRNRTLQCLKHFEECFECGVKKFDHVVICYVLICICIVLYVLLHCYVLLFIVLSFSSDEILQGEAGAGASRCAVSWYLRPHRASCYGNQQPGPGMESAESIGELSVPNPATLV